LEQTSLLTNYAREKYNTDDIETLEMIINKYFEGKDKEIMEKEISPLTLQIVLTSIKLVEIQNSGQITYNQIMANLNKLFVKLDVDKTKANTDLSSYRTSKIEEDKRNKELKENYRMAKFECENLPNTKRYKEETEARVLRHYDNKAWEDLKKTMPGCEASYKNFKEEAKDNRLCTIKYIESDPTGFVMCATDPKWCE
jgi:hypothetical protein